MKLAPLSAALLCIVAISTGCSPRNATSPGVAIVDLDALAKQLDRDAEVVDKVNEKRRSHEAKLKSLQASLASQFNDKRNEMGNAPTGDQTKALADLEQKLNAQLQQAQAQANADVAGEQSRLIQQFREEVEPVARRIAAERGARIVVSRNESFLVVFDPDLDITKAVATAMMRSGAPPATSPSAAKP